MPFAFLLVGALFLVSGIQGTTRELGLQLEKDFTGSQSFVWWSVAIVAVGSLGYVPTMKRFSDTFMALILVALILHNGGIFDKFSQELTKATTQPIALPSDNAALATPAASGSSSGSSGVAGMIGQVASIATPLIASL